MPTTTGPTFRATLAELLDALARLDAVSYQRPPVPILGGLVVDVDDAGVTLSGFDFETSAVAPVAGAQPEEPGRAVVDRAELLRVLKAACKGETRKAWSGWDVDVTARARIEQRGPAGAREQVDTHDVEVDVADFRVPVATFPPANYPSLPEFTADHSFTVDRDALVAVLDRVAVACGRDDTMPHFTGVRIERAGPVLTVAATDRFRLTVGTLHLTDAGPGEAAVLVPHRALAAIIKRAPSGPLTVAVGADGAGVRLSGDGLTATTRTLDAEFPRFRQLIPDRPWHTLVVDAGALRRVAAKADALAAKGASVHLAVADGRLSVAPVTDDQARTRGAGVELLDGTDGDVDGIAFRLHPAYLLDVLGGFDQRVAVGVQEWAATKPVLWAAEPAHLSDGAAPFRHLVMPVRMPS